MLGGHAGRRLVKALHDLGILGHRPALFPHHEKVVIEDQGSDPEMHPPKKRKLGTTGRRGAAENGRHEEPHDRVKRGGEDRAFVHFGLEHPLLIEREILDQLARVFTRAGENRKDKTMQRDGEQTCREGYDHVWHTGDGKPRRHKAQPEKARTKHTENGKKSTHCAGHSSLHKVEVQYGLWHGPVILMPDTPSIQNLEALSRECRIDILRMLEAAGSGHPGGSLSAIDIIVTLFFSEMKMDPKNPTWEDRDRFVLSKGHGVPALYTVLAKKGAIPHDELMTLRKIDSRLQGHPDRAILPFVEASTGSLGQGLSIAQGIAMGLKLQKRSARVFCMLGDGETQEGQIWETALSAPKFKLNNLVVFIDNNNGQIDGHVTEVMDLAPLADKWRSFNWAVHEIDGHNFSEILGALTAARKETDRPTLVVAKTVKGKGVSFMENNIGWHGVTPTAEQTRKAVEEISRGGRS